MNMIAGVEIFAAIFYVIAVILSIRHCKKADRTCRNIFSIVVLAMVLGALISLVDVIEWANREALGTTRYLVEGLEEGFTPLFALLWIIASYTALRSVGKK